MNKTFDPGQAVRVAVAVLSAVVLIVIGGVALYANYLLGLVETDKNTQPNTWETVDPNGPTSDSSGVESIGRLDGMLHFMLLGQDDKDGGSRGRTDAMVLVSVDPKNGKILMTSFMRDLWVTIPHPSGAFDERMNAAFAYGGFDLLRATIQYNFGIEVEDFIMVEFASFAALVDRLGGVNIELTQAEVDYLAKNYAFDLHAGPNMLTGQQALAYSRIRHIDSDFIRVTRQHNVLQSIFQAYKSKPLLELLDVTESVLPFVTVTMDKTEIVGYIARMAPMLSGFTIETHRIPADKTWQFAEINGNDVIQADLEENRNILADLLKP